MRSRLSGLASRSAGLGRTGRRFANRPSPLRRPSRPCSGRGAAGSVVSHFGPPTAASSTASALRQASSTSSVSALPCASIDAPPTSRSSYSNSPSRSRISIAAAMISGPIPSPGRRTSALRHDASSLRRIDHIWEARSSSSAAGQGSAGGPSTVRREAAVRRASSRVGARPGRELERRLLDVGVVDRGPGQAELGGAFAVDPLAEQRQGRGGLAGAGAAEERAVPAARVQADRDEAGDDARVAGDDPQVGGKHQVEAGSDRPPRTAASVGASSSPTRANER